MKCGDVCLVEYPFTDGTAAKIRPIVIASDDAFNGGEDVVVLPVSSSVAHDDKFSVAIQADSPGFRRSGIPSPLTMTDLVKMVEEEEAKLGGRLTSYPPPFPKKPKSE